MLEPVTPLVELMEPDTLRMQAQDVDRANLTQQMNNMGRGFTNTSDLQQDPRVLALREKAIARQQEIDAANDLMAVRQRNQAERLGPARVAQSPIPQRQVVVDHPLNRQFSRQVVAQRTNPDIGDVLERAARGLRLR
jgi:hypothetical protein